jgi:hypothetical protein
MYSELGMSAGVPRENTYKRGEGQFARSNESRELFQGVGSRSDQETKWQPNRKAPSEVRRDQTGRR